MIANLMKILLISISILSVTACANAEAEKTAMVVTEQNVSSVMNNLRHLNVKQNQAIDDKNLQLFLQGYQHIEIGTIDEAEAIFTQLQSSQDNDAIEYGEYGLLLLAFEKESVFNMQRRIEKIERLQNKSEWLEKELINFKVIYNYHIANFDKMARLLDSLPASEMSSSPFLTALKAELYIRENKLDEAQAILQKLTLESTDSISVQARLISLIEGYEKATDYLISKLAKYPDNEYLQLIYNNYLTYADPQQAIDNMYELGLQTQNFYILSYSMEGLYLNAIDQKTTDKLNVIQNKVNQSSVAKNYIEYYLIRLALPINDRSFKADLITANDFNPMNFRLLWHKFAAADEKDELEFLHKIENIDPYENYTLMTLAAYYDENAMDKELTEIKQRFNNSKRFKTEYELDYMAKF